MRSMTESPPTKSPEKAFSSLSAFHRLGKHLGLPLPYAAMRNARPSSRPSGSRAKPARAGMPPRTCHMSASCHFMRRWLPCMLVIRRLGKEDAYWRFPRPRRGQAALGAKIASEPRIASSQQNRSFSLSPFMSLLSTQPRRASFSLSTQCDGRMDLPPFSCHFCRAECCTWYAPGDAA